MMTRLLLDVLSVPIAPSGGRAPVPESPFGDILRDATATLSESPEESGAETLAEGTGEESVSEESRAEGTPLQSPQSWGTAEPLVAHRPRSTGGDGTPGPAPDDVTDPAAPDAPSLQRLAPLAPALAEATRQPDGEAPAEEPASDQSAPSDAGTEDAAGLATDAERHAAPLPGAIRATGNRGTSEPDPLPPARTEAPDAPTSREGTGQTSEARAMESQDAATRTMAEPRLASVSAPDSVAPPAADLPEAPPADSATADPVPVPESAPRAEAPTPDVARSEAARPQASVPSRLAAMLRTSDLAAALAAKRGIDVSLGDGGRVRLQADRHEGRLVLDLQFSDPATQALALAHADLLTDAAEARLAEPVSLRMDGQPMDSGDGRRPNRPPTPSPGSRAAEREAPSPDAPAPPPADRREWVG